VFTHGGHGYRPGEREEAARDEVETLAAGAEALEADGFQVRTRSAGSTPTMTLAAVAGRVDEIRAGTYALGDRQQLRLGAIEPKGIACAVAATVVSATEDRLVIDAGAKTLTKDRAEHLGGFGLLPEYPDLLVERLSDYHGVVVVPPGAPRPVLGEVVAVVPNHICPVVDLRDGFVAVLEDGTPETWPVDARGRSG
jgi:D-serine deaminase-like pyridoxal phosphate-dependent protein